MSPRRIPASGINLFQLIYILIREYETQSGERALNLSLGNPDLIPVEAVRSLKSEIQLRTDYDLHTYAEDKNLSRFCESMVRIFADLDLDRYPHLRAVSTAGIKTATAILPLACGLHRGKREDFSVVTHLPAYDVMGTWEASYLGGKRLVWPLLSSDGMAMNLDRLRSTLEKEGVEKPDLIFVIRPGNPAACGASEAEWKALAEFCSKRGIRLVNDGAYTTLAKPGTHVPLAQVAKDFPDLEWMELFSVSKAFSDPGARLGCAVGSKDFIEDFILIKGNTDSGPVPSMMQTYAELFRDVTLSRKIMSDLLHVYQQRLNYLVPRLKAAGFQPACETTAGFFTLWKTPTHAYGKNIKEDAKAAGVAHAELFNRTVIQNSGIVGVHFTGPETAGVPGEPLIRYAVCTDVLDPAFQTRFERELARIQPKY